ncbi:unnamed protein product [Ixodes persulcatus]
MVRIAACWLLVALGSAVGQFRDDASCSDHVIDSCGTDFLVFSKASQLPDTPEKLAASCTQIIRYLLEYLLFLRIFVVFTKYSASAEYSGTSEYAVFESNTFRIRRIFDSYSKFRIFAHPYFILIHASKHIHAPCIEYSEFYECTERSLRDSCGDPKTIEHVQDTVSNVVGDLLSIVCGRYQRGSADCLALGKLPPLPANQTVPRNLISPLKAIVRSLG